MSRHRRPPRDPFNALLSLGYTLLHGYVDSVNRAVGFLPWQGFYHVARGSHPALASDLVEPFRHVVERVALKLLLSEELSREDFSATPAGACIIANPVRRQFLTNLTQRLEQPVKSRGAEVAQRHLDHMHEQALSLLACVRDGEPFRAFRLR